MAKKHLMELLQYGGLTFLGGTALYMARRNEELESKVKTLRNDFLNQENKVNLLKNTLRITHKKYMKLRDNLKEHVESMVNLKSKEFKGWSEDSELLTESFPEMDIQFLAPDMLIAKLSGLIDAFVLNKWSIIPAENKKIKKSMLANGENLDIYNKADITLVLDTLIKLNYIDLIKYQFILKFYDFYKEKIIIKGELPKEYKHEDIEYFFDFTVNMILDN